MAAPAKEVDLRENHNAVVISIAVVFATLSLLAVIARLVSRRARRQPYTIDDWLLVIAWVIGTSENIMLAAATRFAKGGYHQAALSPHHVVALQKVFYVASFLQTTGLALCKISLLILLHRIFEVVPTFKRTCWVLGGIVIAWWCAAFFGGAFVCYPASHIWEPNSEGTCANAVLLNLITPIPWVLTDFAILIAPIPVIRKLQLDRGRTLRVYAAFLIGAITCIVTVVRYRSIFYSLDDLSYDIVPASLWSMIEIHVTIMCPALMVSGPILTLVIGAMQPKWASWSSRSWSKFPRSWRTDSKGSVSGKFGSGAMGSKMTQNGVPNRSGVELRQVIVEKPFDSDVVLVQPVQAKTRPGGDAYLSLEG